MPVCKSARWIAAICTMNGDEDAVLQLVDISQHWLHRYRTQIVESQLEKPLCGSRGIAQRLQHAQRELTALVKLAQLRLHG